MLRRRRRLLAAAGVLAASLVVGTAVTVGYGLATGFERSAAAAGLPDVIARFDREDRTPLDERVRALPNLAARSYRSERTNVPLWGNGRHTHKGATHALLGGRRGYHIVAGRDLSPRLGDVVVERGLARAWDLEPGDALTVGELGVMRVVGVAVSPDNVAYPLASAARVYLNGTEVEQAFGFRIEPNVALLWLNDSAKADVTLTQARSVSFGLGRLEFVTRQGVQVLLGQAAGIVISLLLAFSLVALAAAGTMLAAGAHADVQRRLADFGVQRALGFTPATIAAQQAALAVRVAAPSAALGLAAGTLAVASPASALLAALNELPPGWDLLPPLLGAFVVILTTVVAAATWPAWRAARRSPASVMRGGEIAVGAAPGRAGHGGLVGLGVRFATAARARYAASVLTIALCVGVLTLMLALASLLDRLRDDPGTLGKRYQLTARLDEGALPQVRRIRGVEAAASRYAVDAADSFRLGEPLRLVAYRGDHTEFEAPPLDAGRRLRGDGEVEVGVGLADALGLRPGSTLAAQLPSGEEARLRVSGVVRALENDGRIAWIRADRLLAIEPELQPSLAIRLDQGADRTAVDAALQALGAAPQPAAGATTRNRAFLGVLAALLRGVGVAVGLVCLYALIQALATTARERRGAVALLRAVGGDARTVTLVLAGAACAVTLPGVALGSALEAAVMGPLVARLAASYATLPIAPGAVELASVVTGLMLLAAVATAVVARQALREPVVSGLREP